MIDPVKLGNRCLYFVGCEPIPARLLASNFILLLPAYGELDISNSLAAARSSLSSNCKEYCCVGPFAAKLEDKIDWFLEDAGCFIATSSSSDAVEACEYFLFGSDGGVAPNLIAAVSNHPELVDILRKIVRACSL